jgi:urease accessory protein
MNLEIHHSLTKDQGHHSHGNHTHNHSHEHGHTHEAMDSPGSYQNRPLPLKRNWKERAFTVGIGGYSRLNAAPSVQAKQHFY